MERGSRLLSQLGRTLRAGTRGRTWIGPVLRPDPSPCLCPLVSEALSSLSLFRPQEARAALEPASEPGFAARLQAQRICLERVEAGPLGVAGSARVLDLAYEKRVSVRWSADGWRSQREVPAAYAGPAPPPPRADRFAFRLPAPPIGGALLFALRYRVTGHEFWDNNGGRDYALRGPEHPGSGGTPEPQGWIHFI